MAALTGATMKELQYWDLIGLVRPSIHYARGQGHRHQWSAEDVRVIRTVVLLRDSGVQLNRIGHTRTVDVLRDPWHAWDGWLVITSRTACIVSDPYAVVDLVAVEGATVTVLNLADAR